VNLMFCLCLLYINTHNSTNYTDEMGLGKTLQTISLLAYLREARGVKGPHLVIVPKSVVGNWIKEFRKWCPSIKAVRMGGTKDERMKARETFLKPDASSGKYKFDALVCSYEAVLKEKTSLGRIPWKYLIIDEVRIIVVCLNGGEARANSHSMAH